MRGASLRAVPRVPRPQELGYDTYHTNTSWGWWSFWTDQLTPLLTPGLCHLFRRRPPKSTKFLLDRCLDLEPAMGIELHPQSKSLALRSRCHSSRGQLKKPRRIDRQGRTVGLEFVPIGAFGFGYLRRNELIFNGIHFGILYRRRSQSRLGLHFGGPQSARVPLDRYQKFGGGGSRN